MITLLPLLLLLPTPSTPLRNTHTPPTPPTEMREIGIVNLSGSNLEIYWTHPTTSEKHLSSPSPFPHNSAFELGSYPTHTFLIHEIPSPKTHRCVNGRDPNDPSSCGRAFFTVGDVPRGTFQAFHIGRGMDVVIKDTVELEEGVGEGVPTGELEDCEGLALEADVEDVAGFMVRCVEEAVTRKMIRASEEIKFQARLRDNLAEKLENYTCADHGLASSTPLRSEEWQHGPSAMTRRVDVLHDRPASRIHLIHNFISKEECRAMEQASAHKLHKATVANGKGGSELSPNRKAMQAGIRIPWNKEPDGNLLTKISRRVYDYTDHVLRMNIDEHGQEDLMMIQYQGRGPSDSEPDRYMPHCDGECKGAAHRAGQRMATVVMYCTVPEVGGATNFRKSGLHVVPEEGMATFFSYVDPETMVMDLQFTEHSGCPVIEGEKKIVTQWIRYGVDKENPWDSFNTLGIKIKDLADQ